MTEAPDRHLPDGRLLTWRQETPGCAGVNHLNNAGAALQPEPVLQATIDHLRLEGAIGGYEAADRAADQIEAVYQSLAELLGTRPANLAVMANGTAAFIQALTSFDLARFSWPIGCGRGSRRSTVCSCSTAAADCVRS